MNIKQEGGKNDYFVNRGLYYYTGAYFKILLPDESKDQVDDIEDEDDHEEDDDNIEYDDTIESFSTYSLRNPYYIHQGEQWSDMHIWTM